jgi:hypothetical protein
VPDLLQRLMWAMTNPKAVARTKFLQVAQIVLQNLHPKG